MLYLKKLEKNKIFSSVVIIILIIGIIAGVYIITNLKQIIKSRADTFNSAGKLGVQISCNFPNSEEFEALIAQQPTVIKLMDDFSCSARIKQISPSTLIVGRIYSPDQPVDGVPETRAEEWFSKNTATLSDFPDIDCWEGYNEPPSFNVGNMAWNGRFEKRRVELLAGIERKACIGNFSVGVPLTPTDDNAASWSAFRPALEAIAQYGGFLGLHEYSAPDMRCLYSEQDKNGFIIGRYRKVYNDYLIPNGLEVPLIITETGITGAICSVCGCNETADVGWRNLGISASFYTDELRFYDSLLEQDSYVKGGAIFISGHPGWPSFETYPDIIGPSGLLISYGSNTPIPTENPGLCGSPGGIPCCNTDVNLNINPENAKVGDNIRFSVISGDASTYTNDDWSGGVTNCTGPWNNKTCTALSSGTFTWTKFWKACEGNINNCSDQCSAQATYIINAHTTPNSSPASTPTPIAWASYQPSSSPSHIPTPTPSQTTSPTFTPRPTPTSSPLPTSIPASPRPTPSSTPISSNYGIPPYISKYDLNADGVINAVDVSILLNFWRQGTTENLFIYDFNGDGKINSFDYSLLLRNF